MFRAPGSAGIAGSVLCGSFCCSRRTFRYLPKELPNPSHHRIEYSRFPQPLGDSWRAFSSACILRRLTPMRFIRNALQGWHQKWLQAVPAGLPQPASMHLLPVRWASPFPGLEGSSYASIAHRLSCVHQPASQHFAREDRVRPLTSNVRPAQTGRCVAHRMRSYTAAANMRW